MQLMFYQKNLIESYWKSIISPNEMDFVIIRSEMALQL